MDEKNNGFRKALRGVCHFHSETGTEGGYWAVQDMGHISKNVGRGYCKKCGRWLKQDGDPVQIVRVHTIDEESLRTGKLAERPSCPDNTHEEEIGDVWDYQGLHILKDGDILRIYSKIVRNQIVWSGTIKLRQYPPCTEGVFGLWIHTDQEGMDRETWAQWFFGEHPAILVTA